MLGLVARILIFMATVIFLSLIGCILTVWAVDTEFINSAYERETESIRLVSIGESDDEYLPIEKRAMIVSSYASEYLYSIRSLPGSGVMHKLISAWTDKIHVSDWFESQLRPKLALFVPTLYIRVETYLTIYICLIPFIIFCYYYGEYFARKGIRQGKHKRNTTVSLFKWGFRILINGGLFLIGTVGMLPVLWWIIPSVMLSGITVTLIRANSIELK